MNTKVKLGLLITVLLACISMCIVGVFAVTETDFKVSGNIEYIVPLPTEEDYSYLTFSYSDEETSSASFSASSTDLTARVIDCDTSVTAAEIPERLRHNNKIYTVTSIGDSAFANCSSLVNIKIPNSVTSIGVAAFGFCESLENISIPKSVTSIREGIFLGSSGLTSITVEDTNSVYEDRDSNAIIEKSSNTLIAGCQNTTILSSVTSIGSYAFYGHTGLKSVNLHENLNSIGESAFNSCIGLTSVTIPTSVSVIETGVFNLCRGLTSVMLPEGITQIGENAFSNCISLANISIPKSVTSIEEQAFSFCESLTSVTIENGITNIGANAFRKCSSLASVLVLGATPATAGETIFYECSALTSIYVPYLSLDTYNTSWTDYTNLLTGFDDAANSHLRYYDYDEENLTTGIGSVSWNDESVVLNNIPEVVIKDNKFYLITYIEDFAFMDYTNLTINKIPDSIISIGNSAFYDCSGITDIIIPDSVISIGGRAFFGCSGITNIIIPDSVTSIGERAFQGCTSLTSVTIGSGVTSLTENPFWGCSSLASIVVDENNSTYDSRDNCSAIIETASNTLIQGSNNTIIPETVTSIGDWACFGLDGLTTVTIPDSVTSIGEGAFNSCISLASVTIGSGLASIDSSAFNNCSSLATIVVDENNSTYDSRNNCSAIIKTANNTLIQGSNNTIIPNTVTAIKNRAFYGSGITNVTIPDSVTEIGIYSFQYCESLTNVTIGSGVTWIMSPVFVDCPLLSIVTINATTPPDYSSDIFSNCSALKYIKVPDNSVDEYKTAWAAYADLIIGNSMVVDTILSGLFSNLFRYSVNTTALTATIVSCIDASVTSVKIPDKVLYNGEMLTVTRLSTAGTASSAPFVNCPSLQSVTIADSITIIGAYAFNNCTALSSVVMSANVESIGNYAFSGCAKLTAIEIPDSCIELGNYAFANTSLISISLPSEMYRIGTYCFGRCVMLESVDMPTAISEIGTHAFDSCQTLANIIFPSCPSVGAAVFINCYSLNTVTMSSTTVPTFTTPAQLFYGCSSLVAIYVPTAYLDAYKSALADWVDYILPTPTPIASISYLQFIFNSTNLTAAVGGFTGGVTRVAIPSTVVYNSKTFKVTAINNRVFQAATTLTAVSIGANVATIGIGAFNGCTGLTSVYLPGVTILGDGAFYNCTSLKYVNMPKVVTIGTDAFSGCSSLLEIHIPASVTSIGDTAFYQCTSLTTVKIDSATIAQGLTSATAYGYLINSATTLYLRMDLAVSTFVRGNFTSRGNVYFGGSFPYRSFTRTTS